MSFLVRNGLSVLLIITLVPGIGPRAMAAEPAVDIDELRPGLVATFRDTSKPAAAEIIRLEPTIALALKGGEAPHPRLAGAGGSYRWEGYVNIVRAGAYRFRAKLRGKVRLSVAGKEVLAAESAGEGAILQEGPTTTLEGGILPLVAEFTRLPGAARLELSWQAPHFRQEPLPHDHLFHLPARVPERLKIDQQVERGRFLVEELSCVRCHQPESGDKLARGLSSRQAPDLSKVGQRVYPGWIYRWLEAPHQLRPGAVMPRMFEENQAGQVERHAVARYLASLGGPVKIGPTNLKPTEIPKRTKRGEQLFASIGCSVCHQDKANEKSQKEKVESQPVFVTSAQTSVPLTGLGSKTTPDKLAAYLANPLTIDPSGRMPHMLLTNTEALDLALFLCQDRDQKLDVALPAAPSAAQLTAAFQRVDPRAEELAAFQRLAADLQLIDLGKRLVIDKGCNNCHTIAPDGKPFASALAGSFTEVKKPESLARGCLAEERHAKSPWFDLQEVERTALRLFLREGSVGAGSAAPAYAGRVALARFNCLGCHQRDGEGGLTSNVIDDLRRHEKAENAEAVSPPPLTGAGHKLRTAWARQVLTQAGRARPWMGLRMPQFGEGNIGKLPEALALLDGTEPDDSVHRVPLSAATIEIGRRLVGKQALGCISCHDIADIVNAGTRGPDLALMNQRVRYDWYRRWLEQAQRMQPGTRMPTAFPDGKSLIADILGGSADAQADALWAYLSLGKNLPLPDGLEPPKGLVLAVTDRPIVVRTFMPEAGARAIAVGYPGGVATAFDATACRLAYAWSGNFLDAAPAWDNRGGSPAKPLGPRFWTAPAGCPLAILDSNDVPDFAARAKEPTHGGPLPDGQVLKVPRQLHFDGYDTDAKGLPILHYRLNAALRAPVEVSEQAEPLKSPVAIGLARRFTVDVPAGHTLWLRGGESAAGDPRLLDARGDAVSLDLKSDPLEILAQGQLLILPQGGERLTILSLASVPEGTHWVLLRRQGGGWQALVRLPKPTAAAKMSLVLNVWAPFRDEPALLKELRTEK